MKVDLKGQVALVTGGAHGMGRAIVQALAISHSLKGMKATRRVARE